MRHRNPTIRFPAILAAILATSLTAAAQPKLESVAPNHTESTWRVSLQDNKKKKAQKVVKVRQAWDWFEVGDATPAKHGTVFFVVADDARQVGKLRIDAIKGKLVVRRLRLHFVDGTMRTFAVNKALDDRRARSTVIELGGIKTIERVVVTTDVHSNGEYAIFGSTSGVAQQTCC